MNKNFVLPKTFLIGSTQINLPAIMEYLQYTDQLEFLEDINAAQQEGLSDGEILCSFYAKMCYASLTDKKNKNISRTRSIQDNIIATIESLHGSVFEHASLNFAITDCSRVFTHELVRHRQGTAFSQTSGRYVRSDEIKIVFDPILSQIEAECEALRLHIENWYKDAQEKLGMNDMKNFDQKKSLTSALRRFLPNGQANEIGFSVNLRALRFTIQQRTSQHAEWEIRVIFNQVAELMKAQYPMMFCDASYKEVKGLNEITFKNHKIT